MFEVLVWFNDNWTDYVSCAGADALNGLIDRCDANGYRILRIKALATTA